MKNALTPIAVLAAAVGSLQCTTRDDEPNRAARRGKPVVCTTLYPLHYFVQRIAGDLVDASCLVAPGVDPLHWKPTTADIQRLQSADLIVLNGANAESWADTLALPISRIAETSYVFHDRYIEIADAVVHSHGPGDSHTHAGVDPHTWMDPRNALAQAEQVAAGLARTLPDQANQPDQKRQLDAGMKSLAADLDGLHARFEALGKQPADEVLVASHPAYNYIAKRYGWRIVNLDLDPSEALGVDALGAEALAAARAKLGGQQARYILWDSEPTQALANQVRSELGLEGVLFAPCETAPGPGEPDYLAAMNANLDRVRVAFGK